MGAARDEGNFFPRLGEPRAEIAADPPRPHHRDTHGRPLPAPILSLRLHDSRSGAKPHDQTAARRLASAVTVGWSHLAAPIAPANAGLFLRGELCVNAGLRWRNG